MDVKSTHSIIITKINLIYSFLKTIKKCYSNLTFSWFFVPYTDTPNTKEISPTLPSRMYNIHFHWAPARIIDRLAPSCKDECLFRYLEIFSQLSKLEQTWHYDPSKTTLNEKRLDFERFTVKYQQTELYRNQRKKTSKQNFVSNKKS